MHVLLDQSVVYHSPTCYVTLRGERKLPKGKGQQVLFIVLLLSTIIQISYKYYS